MAHGGSISSQQIKYLLQLSILLEKYIILKVPNITSQSNTMICQKETLAISPYVYYVKIHLKFFNTLVNI